MSGYEVNARNKSCPVCNGLIPADAAMCTRCGLNFKTGRRTREAERDPADAQRKADALRKARKAGDLDAVAQLEGKPASKASTGGGSFACAECGYDLTGLGGRPCPECGNDRRVGSQQQKRREERVKHYWLAALLTACIGTPAGVALAFYTGMTMRSWDVTDCLVHIALCEGALFISYFVMCFFFLGFEEDVRGLALRLVGVAALWAGLWAWSRQFGFGLYGATLVPAVVATFALAAPLKWLTDREWDDCFWIAGVAWALHLVPALFLLP